MTELEANFPSRWSQNLLSLNILNNSDHIAGNVTSFHPPWTLRPIITDIGLKSLTEGSSRGMTGEIMRKHIQRYLDHLYKESVMIFTDAARSIDGRVGAAVFIPSISLKLAYRLTDNVSVDAAELDAIYQALALTAKYKFLRTVIVSDSLNAINSLSCLAIHEHSKISSYMCRSSK